MSRLALVDGDVFCYLSFEPRWNYFNKQGVMEKVWNPETERFEIKQPEWTEEQDTQYFIESWERFQRKVHDVVEKTYASDFLMAVQGDDNYRKRLFDLYKMSSTRTKKPSEMSRWVPKLQKLAVQSGMAIASHGREADDLLRIWAEEARAVGQDYVIISIDKDLRCIPGKHYDIKKEIYYDVSELDAHRLYYEQLLQGDSIDNIPGIPGIGPKRAQRALAHCTTVSEFQEAVVETYIKSFGDNWKQHLLANGKLIHIQKHENDWFDLTDWPVVEEMNKCTTVAAATPVINSASTETQKPTERVSAASIVIQ